MRTVPLLLVASSLAVLAACRGTPPVSVQQRLTISPRLTELAPSNVAVLPVEDATRSGTFDLGEDLRAAVAAGLPGRLYAPLSGAAVDASLDQRGGVTGSVVDPGYVGMLRGSFGADAILGLRVTEWDVSDVMRSPPQVRFSVDVLMVASGTDEQLCTGTYSGVLKPGGDAAAPLERSARIRAAAVTLGEMLAEVFPERNLRPVR